MRKTLLGLVCVVFLISCMTFSGGIQNSKAYITKQAIAKETRPTRHTVSFPQNNPSDRPSLTFSKYLAKDIGWLQEDEGETIIRKIQAYARTISYSAEPVYVNAWTAWNGEKVWHADIGELIDLNKTWVRVQYTSWVEDSGIKHKCAYASNPNTWTIEECPTKGSVG